VFTAIGAGDIHTCGVTTVGAMYCWGFNGHGELGDSATTNRTAPVRVVGSGTAPLVFAAVAAGAGHTCGLTVQQTIYCWGYGLDGALGNGTRTNELIPVAVIQ